MCEEARRIYHKEYVSMIALNKAGTCLATAGISAYRIWELASGKELFCLLKTNEALTTAIAFGFEDHELYIGLNDCSVTCYNLKTSIVISQFVAEGPLCELQGCPRVMAISPDLRKAAIAW
jgi:WD40 repeat protein